MGPSHCGSASRSRFSETTTAKVSQSLLSSVSSNRNLSARISPRWPNLMAQADNSTVLRPARGDVNECRDMNLRPTARKTRSNNTQAISSSPLTTLLVRAASSRGRRGLVLVLALGACTLLVLLAQVAAAHPEISGTEQVAAVAADTTRAALEAELNAILQAQQQQQQQDQDANSKLMSEAIISRLMLGNMSDLGAGTSADLDGAPQPQSDENGSPAGYADAARLRRVLSLLQNYEMMQGGGDGGQAGFSQYPVLPASQAATIKRASMKVGNYLRAQQQSGGQHTGQRQLASYGRVNSFDFGLGKRPDASIAGNILRFGDSASAGGHMAPISGASGLGKRPSAHRYDFGLGKRVASPAYPRYDFGLGKRAPSRLRYDFGLGRRR